MRCRAHAVFWSTAVSAGRLGDFAVWCPCPALPPGLLGGGLEGGWWNRKGEQEGVQARVRPPLQDCVLGVLVQVQ